MFPTRRITTSGGDKFRDEYSLAFDGSNDYVDLGTNFESTLFNSDFSVSVWIKATDGRPSSDEYFIGTKDGNDNFWIRIETDGDIQFYYKDGSTESNLIASGYFADGASNWVNLVFTVSNSSQKIYANGVSIASATTSIDSSGFAQDTNRNLVIGARNNAGTIGGFFAGNISELAFYTTTLTANQVKTIYNGREPYNHKEGVASGNLQAWYRMGDGSLDEYSLICDETNATLGSNLITNGTFDADSDWSKGTGWTIGSGVASSDGSQSGTSNLSESSGITTTGKMYKCSVDITSYTAGNIRFNIGGSANTSYFSGAGKHTLYGVANGSTFHIAADLNFIGSVDNVTVQEVGASAGLMNNMSATDIEGDTP